METNEMESIKKEGGMESFQNKPELENADVEIDVDGLAEEIESKKEQIKMAAEKWLLEEESKSRERIERFEKVGKIVGVVLALAAGVSVVITTPESKLANTFVGWGIMVALAGSQIGKTIGRIIEKRKKEKNN